MNKFYNYIDFIRNTLEESKEISAFVNIIDLSDFFSSVAGRVYKDLFGEV